MGMGLKGLWMMSSSRSCAMMVRLVIRATVAAPVGDRMGEGVMIICNMGGDNHDSEAVEILGFTLGE